MIDMNNVILPVENGSDDAKLTLRAFKRIGRSMMNHLPPERNTT